MRWLIRKVVKLVLEVILESNEFDAIIKRIFKLTAIPHQSFSHGKINGESHVSVMDSDGLDSSRALADVIIGGAKKIEMSGMSREETVVVSKSGNSRGVLDMLNNIDETNPGD